MKTKKTKQYNCISVVCGTNDPPYTPTPDTEAGRAWSSQSRALGRLWYQTFTNNDFNIYLEVSPRLGSLEKALTPASDTQDFMHRLPGKQHYHNGSADDMEAGGYEAGMVV